MSPPDTERLSFRLWEPADVERFQVICSDAAVMQFVGDGEIWSRERCVDFLQRATEMQQMQGYCQWALVHREAGSLIGYCGFVATEFGPEVGWRLAPEAWGLGLATEAARRVFRHGFETLGFSRIVATVQSANTASLRVIEKLGMVFEDRFERSGREVCRYSIERFRQQ